MVFGYSYGAAVALQWRAANPRLRAAVAIAPYAVLSNAVLNVRREYAPLVPERCIRAGLKRLPGLLEVGPQELDTVTFLSRHPVDALLVAGGEDRIAPVEVVARLQSVNAFGSRLLVVPQATHETIPFLFAELVGPVVEWFSTRSSGAETAVTPPRALPGAP